MSAPQQNFEETNLELHNNENNKNVVEKKTDNNIIIKDDDNLDDGSDIFRQFDQNNQLMFSSVIQPKIINYFGFFLNKQRKD